MKTISGFFNINNNGINQSTTANKEYYQTYDQAAGDLNRNATKTQVEYERDTCEEELYRLRYGMENLLANNEQGDSKGRQRITNTQNPFRTMMSRTVDLNDRKNKSWMDRCSPCCRRWRRNRYNDNVNIPNSYHSRRASESPFSSDPFTSASPSPYINRTKSDLRQSISSLINPNRSVRTDGSDLPSRRGTTDPAYNSLLYKILEAKALDCLCTGYSKQNTQIEITKGLDEINQRSDQNQWDSSSASSSPSRYESSSSVSSLLSTDRSLSPRSVTSVRSNSSNISPSHSGIQTPNLDVTTPSLISPDDGKHKIKSSLKLNENIKSPKKNSKVTIVANEGSKSKGKSKKKKKPSSKNRKNKSKKPTKSTSRTKKRKVSNKKRSSSKTKNRKSSSKSPSRSKSRKKRGSRKRKKSRKKKAKSNNQISDRETTFIYPQSYHQTYQNRQRILKLLLSST